MQVALILRSNPLCGNRSLGSPQKTGLTSLRACSAFLLPSVSTDRTVKTILRRKLQLLIPRAWGKPSQSRSDWSRSLGNPLPQRRPIRIMNQETAPVQHRCLGGFLTRQRKCASIGTFATKCFQDELLPKLMSVRWKVFKMVCTGGELPMVE